MIAKLTDRVHDLVREVLRPGDWALDATAGNGRDTLFLGHCVGPTGRIFAFDIQGEAIEATRRRLQEASIECVELLQAGHERMREFLPEQSDGRFGTVLFNLGYLPGGDKSIITHTASTLAAIGMGLSLLRSGGLLTILAYRGHPGGREETDAVRDYFSSLSVEHFTLWEEGDLSPSPKSPILYAVTRK